MTLFDHFLILLLFLVQPIYGWLDFRRYLKKIAAGEPADRPKLYRETLVLEWVFLAVLLAGFFGLSRDLSTLGFVSAGGTGFWICAALLAGGSIAMILSTKSTRQLSQSARDKQRAALGDLGHFLPQNDRDLASFYRVSVTAGIVEEIVFRGFVLWYLSFFMPLWPAVLVSSVAFGLAHSYQGISGMIRVSLIGLAFGALFVFSGSIWLPIVGHILVDVLQGRQLREIYRDVDEPAAA
jgi:membrane protease YdiL (CAAX protease family)